MADLNSFLGLSEEDIARLRNKSDQMRAKLQQIKMRSRLPEDAVVVTVDYKGNPIDISIKPHAYRVIPSEQMGHVLLQLIQQAATSAKARAEEIMSTEVDPEIEQYLPGITKKLNPDNYRQAEQRLIAQQQRQQQATQSSQGADEGIDSIW